MCPSTHVHVCICICRRVFCGRELSAVPGSRWYWRHWTVSSRFFPFLQGLLTPFVIVQLLTPVWLFETPWTAACHAFLSFTISWSLLRLMSTWWMMPSNHLVLCQPLLLLPSAFPITNSHPNWSFPMSWLFGNKGSHRITMGKACALQLESKPLLSTAREEQARQQRPSIAQNKYIRLFKKNKENR